MLDLRGVVEVVYMRDVICVIDLRCYLGGRYEECDSMVYLGDTL